MKKLVIVDDNRVLLEDMKTILNWQDYDMQIVALCENGLQAYEYACNNEVDIIICDIEMPVLNGIALLKRLRDEGNNVEFLFMSCYDEFDFVKSAIDLNATGYVLKPIIAEELESEIFKILNIYKIKDKDDEQKKRLMGMVEQSLPILREHFFRELLLGVKKTDNQIDEALKLLKINFSKPYKLQVAIIKIYENQRNSISYDADNIIALLALGDMIKALSTDEISANAVTINDSSIAIVFVYKDCNVESIMDIYDSIKDYCKHTLGIKTSFGISNESDSLSGAGNLFRQAHAAVNTQFYSEDDRFILFSEVETVDWNLYEKIDIPTLQLEVNKIISECDMERAKFMLSQYFDNQNDKFSSYFMRYFAYTLLNLIVISVSESNVDFNNILDHSDVYRKLANIETILNMKQWFINIFKSVFETIEETKSLRDKTLVEKVKEIIEKEYSHHITLDWIASQVYFSGVHMNNIFKKETGSTVFDYLVEFRMKKAQEMLKMPRSKIYAVAQTVGYKNQAHFKFLFKQYTGMTPMDYKFMFEENS